MVGTSISHYKVLEKIGQGGMGEVFLAHDTNLKREVAIKVLPEQFTQDPQRLASLSHPNIAAGGVLSVISRSARGRPRIRDLLFKARRKLSLAVRRTTSSYRTLPDFIIIGAMRSGTSSLFWYLAQHPQVVPSYRKEVNFFDVNFGRGEHWYRAHFPLKKQISANSVTGEASPLYLYSPLAAQRMSSLVPNVKLIAFLRNPSERAISQYYHNIKRNREHLSLWDALHEEEDRVEEFLLRGDFTNFNYIHYSYKRRGLYQGQLARYWRHFPRDRLLILNSEEFFHEPLAVLRRVFRFLNVEEDFEVTDLEPRSVGTNREEVEPRVYEYLNEYFARHNQELYREIGRSFEW